MKSKSVLSAVAMVMCVIFLFGGCANKGNVDKPTGTTESGKSETKGENKEAKNEETKKDEPKPENKNEKTIINIWTKDRHDAKYVQAKVDEYNQKSQDVEVVYTLYTDNYQQAADLAAQNGELPDILVFQNNVFDKHFGQGQWADLYQFMDEDMKKYFADVIIPGLNELDGKLYFIPTTGTACRLFYNKEIFERVGIKEPPKTLEEVLEYSRKITGELKGEGIYGFAGNMKSASSALNRSMIVGLQRETGTVSGYNFKEGKYDFSGWKDQLLLWKQLLAEDSAMPGCESLDIDPLRTQFAAGKIGMYFSYSHAEPGVYANQFPMDSAKWDAVPIPTTGGKVIGKQNFGATSAYILNAKSPNLETAFRVYKELFTSEEYLTGYYEGGYGVSIIPAIIEKANPSEDYKNKKWLRIHPEMDAILPKAPHAAFAAGIVVEGENMYKIAESVYYGDADVDAALADLNERYNKAYQEAIKNGTGYEIKIPNYDPMNPTLK